MFLDICAPALLNIGFSLAQIIIDIFKQYYNTAFIKFIIMIIFTIILNKLCQVGYAIISWFIVFIPFIFITVITSILLFVFGLDPKTGTFNYKIDKQGNNNKNSNSKWDKVNRMNNYKNGKDKNKNYKFSKK